MGDTVLFEDEVNAAMTSALDTGLSVTALHNHFFFDHPKVFFMHIEGDGAAEQLAGAVKKMYDAVKQVRAATPQPKETFGANPPPDKSSISVEPLNKIFGATGDVSETTVMRETFAYGGASRDPFASLIKTAHAGPELVDLQLVGIYEDLRYSGNSIAVLREKSTGKRYKLRAGEQVGRLRVMQVRSKDVVFTIQDFGYERQETLSLRKLEDVTP